MLLALIGSCDRSPTPPRPSPTTAPASAPSEQEQADLRAFLRGTARPASPALPAGHPPLDSLASAATRPSEPLGGSDMPAPVLKYTVPAGWQEDPNRRTPLRFAQYRLPRAAGDNQDAELAVLVGMGGGVEANLERWRKQFTSADGAELPDEAVRVEKFTVGQLRVTLLDVAGRYRSDAMALSGQEASDTDYRMLAAIVETAGVPWYFKLVGPSATVSEHRDRFLELLRSLHAE